MLWDRCESPSTQSQRPGVDMVLANLCYLPSECGDDW